MVKVFATRIKAIDPTTGDLVTWHGDNVEALTEGMAQEWLNHNGKGYMKVVGELVAEIPCFEGTFEPDFSRMIDYRAMQNN